MSPEKRLLLKLKDEDRLKWKDIQGRFAEIEDKKPEIAALQMRYTRLRDSMRVWSDDDVAALRLAEQYWNSNKWKIVASQVSILSLVISHSL